MMISKTATPTLFSMLEQTRPRQEREEFRLPSLGEAAAAFSRKRGTSFTDHSWCARCSEIVDHEAMPIGEGTLALRCLECDGGQRLHLGHDGRFRREYVLPNGLPDPAMYTVFKW